MSLAIQTHKKYLVRDHRVGTLAGAAPILEI